MLQDLEISQKHIWRPFTQAKISPAPIKISHARGAYIYTQDNKKLFDGISSWWVNAHGHCHPHISKAISNTAQNLDQIIFANFTHEPALKLTQKLISHTPDNLTRVFFSDNGSTSVEIALKICYQYWQNKKQPKKYFIALEHGYHGDTLGAMSVSERSVFTKSFWPLLFDVLHIEAPCISQISSQVSPENLVQQKLENIKKIMQKYRNQIAGIIFEPMLQGAGGMRIFAKNYLSGLAKLCRENNILIISDEVATGFYRTGKKFAVDHENIMPDIMCLAKGLTNGSIPLAVTLTSENIYKIFLSNKKQDAFFHGHSFTANPIGCAAAIASLELFEKQETKNNIKIISDIFAKYVHKFNNLKNIKNTRSLGCVFACELETSDAGYLSRYAEKIQNFCFDRGLFIRPLGNIIYLWPPFCASQQEITNNLEILHESICQNSSE